MSSHVASLELQARPRGRSLAFAVTFVLLALLSACVALIPHMAFVALSACYLGVFLAYMGFRSDPQGGNLFEVIVPLSVLSFLYFGVGTMYLVIAPKAQGFPTLAPFLLPAQALSVLGFLCFIVGYGWFFRTIKPSPMARFVPGNAAVYLVPTVLGTIGMSAQQFQLMSVLNQQSISSGLSLLQQFGSLLFFGWFLAWYMTWSGRLVVASAIPLLLVMTAMVCVVLYFDFGSKWLAVTLLGMPAMAYYEVKRKLPMKSIVAVVLVFLFVIFPMFTTFRRMDRSLGTTRRLDRAFDVARTWDSEAFLDVSVFAFLDRMTIVNSVAAIVSDTGRWVDYRYGDTLILAPIGLLIPRFLWPDKPSIGIGREFGSTFRLTTALDTETDIAPSMIGEFYWNFSLPGVVVGMWLLGMGYRWYYQRYGAGTGFDPIRKAVYFTILPSALLMEGSVAIVVTGVIKILVILVLFVLVAQRLGWLHEPVDVA